MPRRRPSIAATCPGIAPIEKAFREAYFRDDKPKQQLRFEQLAVRPPAGWKAVHDHSS